MTAEIEKYIEIQNNIDEILKNSPFKMSYIIEKSGIKKPTFFKKLKESGSGNQMNVLESSP